MTRKSLSNILALSGLALAFLASFGVSLAFGKSLTVSVSGIRSDAGVVHVVVYNDAQSFSEVSIAGIVTFATENVQSGALDVTFTGLSAGTYALMLHHDENQNDELDVSRGLPLEGWSFSNNVGAEDMPTFEEASFVIENNSVHQSVTMLYAN